MSRTLTDDRQVGSSPSDPTGDGDASAPRRPQPRRGHAAVRVFSVVTVLAVVGLGWLGYEGFDAARRVKGGATATVITDPAAPGFVAAVDATPVYLVALTDADDALSAFLLFVPDPGGGVGSIVWTLGELIVEVDGNPVALTEIYSSEGLDAARAEFEKVLGLGATDAIIVGPAELEAVATPLGTVEVDNPDPVSVEVKGKRTEKYESGPIELEPDELGDFLTVRGAGEAPENRSTRASVLLAELAALLADPDAATGTSSSAAGVTTIPTVSDSGMDLGSVLTAMGGTDPDFIVLPTERQSFKGSYLYSPDTAAVPEALVDVVQFPISSFPGQRPRVRVLNGTTDTSVANAVAPELARAGGDVLLIGNASSLDAATTSVVYSDDAFKEVADRIAESVGATAERTDDVSDATDIDVVLGADYQR